MPRPRRPVDELLLTALATGQTQQAAARLAGCSVRTVERRMADPAFRAALEVQRQQMREWIQGEVKQAALQALNTLKLLLASDKHEVRLEAAVALLRQVPKRKPVRRQSLQGLGPLGLVQALRRRGALSSLGLFATPSRAIEAILRGLAPPGSARGGGAAGSGPVAGSGSAPSQVSHASPSPPGA